MKITILFLSIISVFLSGLMLIYIMLKIKLTNNREKLSVFECGFDNLTNLRLPFSLHFYLVSIVFLIFDIELILMLPFIFIIKMVKMKTIILMMTIIIIILIIGFIYEWAMGLMGWLI